MSYRRWPGLLCMACVVSLSGMVNAKLGMDSWQHIQVTSTGAGVFALDMKDMTGDSRADIVAGQYFYRNPGGDMTGKWEQSKLPDNLSGYLILDIPGEPRPAIFAGKCNEQYLLVMENLNPITWKSYKVGTSAVCNHNALTQGALKADVFKKDGKLEVLVSERSSTTGSIYAFSIPNAPRDGAWPVLKIAGESNGEGIAAGDVDNDGFSDLFGAAQISGRSGTTVLWWKNPGTESANWTRTIVGTAKSAERVACADIDGNGRPDVVVTEENGGTSLDCYIYWFDNQGTPGEWTRRTVNAAARNGTFGMSVADMDADGDPDVVTGENGRGSFDGKEETTIWENVDKATRWEKHVVAVGKESHHGSRAFDMDNDGDFDIVSIGFDATSIVNLFRNDAIRGSTSSLPATLEKSSTSKVKSSRPSPNHLLNGKTIKTKGMSITRQVQKGVW